MEKNNENTLKYYEQLRNVPQEAKKPFSNGKFSGTDINPMWRIKRMTEIFGMCGIGWYIEVVNRHLEQSIDGKTISAFMAINLYVKVNGEWSKPIYGEGGNSFVSWNNKKQILDTSDEAFKMAYTDAFSNAAKQLGLGADVWFENDKIHSTKYDRQQELAAISPKYPELDVKSVDEAMRIVNNAATKDELKRIGEYWEQTNPQLVEIIRDKFRAKYETLQ